MDGFYPGMVNGEPFDRAREREYRAKAGFMLRHQVPNWVGEFGCIYENPARNESNLRVMNDMIDIIEAYGHHWSIWTYKDIGMMGAVLVESGIRMDATHPTGSSHQNRDEMQFLDRADSWAD